MDDFNINSNIKKIIDGLGNTDTVITRFFEIGNKFPIQAVLLYVNSLADRKSIDMNILKPLMLYTNDNLRFSMDICSIICKKYITSSSTSIEKDIHQAIFALKRGDTVLIIERTDDFIIIDTRDGDYRQISEPLNEYAVRGSREGFVENLETNVSMIRRMIKHPDLTIENFTLGKYTQTDIKLIYIDSIADKKIMKNIHDKLSVINVDSITGAGIIEQYIEGHPYSLFPQCFATERPDIVINDLMEGRAAILCQGTPYALVVPALFIEFFQAIEDYYERSILSSTIRILRLIAVVLVITLPAAYLSFIKFNAELIPIKFLLPLVSTRRGLLLTPLIEILSMEMIVEFLREGGLRLPGKIGQTLSLVGGFIIGDAALKARLVSPATLVVVGTAVIGTFVIPNYDMSLSIRIVRFPMIMLADIFGIVGIAAGWYLILLHLFSMKSFGVPYLSLKKHDLEDTFIRAQLWNMDRRPEAIPNKNSTRHGKFMKKFRRKH
ncbi:spore germination protein [Clostridium sp. LBM24168]